MRVRSVLVSAAAVLVAVAVAAPSASASAAPRVIRAATTGSTYLCGPDYSDYNCLSGTGYTGQSVWGSWGPGHNCVSYAAYRLEQNGSPKPWSGNIGNAVDWEGKAQAAGYTV